MEPSSEMRKQHRYHLIESISNTDNESPILTAITPICKNAGWACQRMNNGRITNKFYLIDSRRNVVHRVTLDTDIYMLRIHPVTRQLLLINDQHNCVRSIDTITGKTTQIVKCPIDIQRLKVTHDNHVIVGSRGTRAAIYKYQLTGELVKKSVEKYDVQDIDHCPKTSRVAIATDEGLTLLNLDLTMMNNYRLHQFNCSSAIFDSHSNLIVADYSNKEIIVLEGDSLRYIQKLDIDGITSPAKLRLYDNVLWANCVSPDKLICVQIS